MCNSRLQTLQLSPFVIATPAKNTEWNDSKMSSTMLEPADKVLAFCGTLAGGFATWMYFLYRNRCREASQIQDVEMVKIGHELKQRLHETDDHCIAYAGVEGFVTEFGKTICSNHSAKDGVILKTTLVEHKSKRTQGIWSDVKKVLMDTLETTPFALCDSEEPGHVMIVDEPTEAEYLLCDLEVTHHEFVPYKSSAMQAGLDRIFGEVVQGYEKTEEMLVVGTSLLGIGEIFLDKGKLRIRPPQTGYRKYFLTTLSKNQLVKLFQNQATAFKVLYIMFGVTAAGLVGYVLWKVARRYLEYRKTQKELEEIRLAALRRRGQARDGSAHDSDESCVVCLNNPREVVTLDCGHISLCLDCTQLLPQPRRCPVCRGPIQRFLPIYRP